jgi:GTP cyclohydrolase I
MQREDYTTNGTNESSVSESESAIDWKKAQKGTRLLLQAVGADPDAGHLQETWRRRVPKSVESLSSGLREAEKPTMRTFETECEELVVKTQIPLYSLCEHHLLPFTGVAHVAYCPDKQVVGLSKLSRYVCWQACQPTMQERLARDIATGLQGEIGATGVVVEITATHLCEAMRGVETATETTTRATAGEVMPDDHRQFDRAVDRAGDSS